MSSIPVDSREAARRFEGEGGFEPSSIQAFEPDNIQAANGIQARDMSEMSFRYCDLDDFKKLLANAMQVSNDNRTADDEPSFGEVLWLTLTDHQLCREILDDDDNGWADAGLHDAVNAALPELVSHYHGEPTADGGMSFLVKE